MIRNRNLAFVVALAGFCLAVTGARADFYYQVDGLPVANSEIFNNSVGTETEDCWVANSFTVSASGTHITAIDFVLGGTAAGAGLTNQSVITTLYTGSSLTSPSAGGGLSRIVASTTTTLVTGAQNAVITIPFASAIDLPVGQIFYAAILIRGVPGSLFPFSLDHVNPGTSPTPLGRSFFDVGATQGAAYNLDVTTRATVMGGSHPVVDGAQDPGNLGVRVLSTPEPTSLALLALGLTGVISRRRRSSVA